MASIHVPGNLRTEQQIPLSLSATTNKMVKWGKTFKFSMATRKIMGDRGVELIKIGNIIKIPYMIIGFFQLKLRAGIVTCIDIFKRPTGWPRLRDTIAWVCV